MKALRIAVVFAVVGLFLAGPAAAQRPVDERAFRGLVGPVTAGQRVVTEPITLEDGTAVTLEVSPLRVFAEGAEIVVHGPLGEWRAPLPSDRWFTGTVVGDPESLVVLAVGTSVRGLVVMKDRVATIAPERGAYRDGPPGRTVIRTFSPESDAPDAMRLFRCDADSLPTPPEALAPKSPAGPLSSVMYYSGVAVETDYELYAKFNSVSNLTNYVGDLFAAISAVYQRDVLVTQQVNYLSIWTTSADPWTATNSSGALSEFVTYWNANRTAVPRSTAHMLAGRSLGGGIANLDQVCSGYAYGVTGSLSGVSPPDISTTYWDFFAATHELGHNFGSVHTHCYVPPVDKCYAGEAGCYSGPTSVPPEKGTVMSYCHLIGGYSAVKMFLGVTGETSEVVKTTIRSFVESRSSCFGTAPGPVVTGISPPAGTPAGGTSVTISGTGFASGVTVKIGGSGATSVVRVNATTITAVTPAHASGSADVTVINPGNQGYTLVGGYTFSCTSATPTAGNTGPYCAGATISLSTPAVSGATYAWTGPNGFASSVQNPTIPNATAANAGIYSIIVTAPGCTASSPGTTAVTVNPVPAPYITAPASAMPGITGLTASVLLHAGNSYLWGIANGAITAGATTNQITFTAGASGTTVLSVVETTTVTGCTSPATIANVYIDGQPGSLVEDAYATGGTVSNVNGVLEPGETVLVNPAWKNISASPLALTGTASAFTGPAGATYSLLDSTADYGTIAPGATADSWSVGVASYRLSVSNPTTRPAAHWDATFLETLSNGIPKSWTLHVGRSFSEVPVSDGAYRFVETLLHNGITAGCGGGHYCPAGNVTRWQMAVFLATAMVGPGGVVPATGNVPSVGSYDCSYGGHSRFGDVPPTDAGCRFIHYIYAEGLTTGCGSGIYCPASNVNRWQMAVFLATAMAGSGSAVPSSGTVPSVGTYICASGGMSLFGDVPPTDPGCKFIHYSYAGGVTAGCGGGNYCPDGNVTRWQMAPFLVTAFKIPLLY